LIGPTNGKIVLKRQTAHADVVAGFPVLLSGLRRTAEPVWTTRLQTFSSFTLRQDITGNDGFLTKSLLTKRLHLILNNTWHSKKKRWVLMEKSTPFDEIL